MDTLASQYDSTQEDEFANLPCPKCGYFLRGLPGEFLRCPECGLRVDRACLVSTTEAKSTAAAINRRNSRESAAKLGAIGSAGLVLGLLCYGAAWDYFVPITAQFLAFSGTAAIAGLWLCTSARHPPRVSGGAFVRFLMYAVPAVLLKFALLIIAAIVASAVAQNGAFGVPVFAALLLSLAFWSPTPGLDRRALESLFRDDNSSNSNA